MNPRPEKKDGLGAGNVCVRHEHLEGEALFEKQV